MIDDFCTPLYPLSAGYISNITMSEGIAAPLFFVCYTHIEEY